MIFRAVFCDIDGTLLDSSHRLRPATARRVGALHSGGVPFILVSARSPGGVFPVQRELRISGPIVCYGGALVLDGAGHAVHSLTMDAPRTLGIKKRILSAWPDTVVSVYSGDNWFVDDRADPRVVREAGITGAVPTEAGMDALGKQVSAAHKIFCVGSPEDVSTMEAAIAGENPDLAVIKSNPRYLEIMNGNATKANALAYLCRAMRISPAETVAFGDNFNDLDMLESAGLGIAMGNAPIEVKNRAAKVTADNDGEGVLLALDSLKFKQLPNSVRFERASFNRRDCHTG